MSQNNFTIQLKRGNSTKNESYIGVNGELTVDTEQNTLRIHDGVTAGGHSLVNLDDLIFTLDAMETDFDTKLANKKHTISDITDLTSGKLVLPHQTGVSYPKGQIVTFYDRLWMCDVEDNDTDLTPDCGEWIMMLDCKHLLQSTGISTQNTMSQDAITKAISSAIDTLGSSKQDTLISGANIKTVNGTSLLGNGDLTVTAAKLDTARTIALSGAVTGTATSFDGSDNINIPTTSIDGTKITGTIPSASYTDTITTINGKTGAISKSDITALGIPAQDTVYTHPTNHSASIITQDANNRFVSDSEKATWNNKWDYDENTVKAVKVNNAGNSDTATKLKTARTINGTSFDGSANIIINTEMNTNIASAATTNIGATNTKEIVHVTGTTTITSLGISTTGVTRTVIFDGSLTLIYNASKIIFPANVNIKTDAGDVFTFICEDGANAKWRCISSMPARIW